MQQTTQPAPAAQPAPKPKPVPPPEFQEKDIATMEAPALIAILKDAGASDFQKAKACQRIGELGAKDAVPALAHLLASEHLSTYARYGLEPIADPSVDDALIAALAKLKGNQLIGAINSLSKRRAAKAVPALTRLMYGPDLATATAAASALGHIAGAGPARELQAAMARTKAPLRNAVADACLVCAERLIGDGHRDQGLALYSFLSSGSTPKPVRLGAMNAIIREEISLTRPR